MKATIAALAVLFGAGVLLAGESAVIKPVSKSGWRLHNDVMSLTLEFKDGKLAIGSLKNLEAGVDYLSGQPAVPLYAREDGMRRACARNPIRMAAFSVNP